MYYLSLHDDNAGVSGVTANEGGTEEQTSKGITQIETQEGGIEFDSH